jgi:heme O synthase-like polyprenyltransferase
MQSMQLRRSVIRSSSDCEFLFLWQVPHFLAIAWIHRADYGRAGLCMLSSVDPEGSATGRQMIV